MDCCKTKKEKSFERTVVELIICIFFALPLLINMGVPFLPLWAQFGLSTVVQFWFGWPFYRSTWTALRKLHIGMDALIILGTSAAYLFSVVVFFGQLSEHTYFETGAIIITLVLVGRMLEARATKKTSGAIRALIELQPKMAIVKRDTWVEVPIAEVRKGDLFRVKPGEKVALDGEIMEGESHINEAMLTGESQAVHKRPGDKLFGGTLNGAGLLVAKATAIGEESALAQIIKLVSEAQSSRAPVQNWADRVSSVFVPIVLAISLLTLISWWFVANFAEAIINAVAVLVIACPCALGLAIPTVIVVAVGRGAKAGILIRHAEAIERARELKVICFDKTGTLTEGKPQVVEKPKPEMVEIAAALEEGSEHPLGQAIAALGTSKKATDFKAISGKGVEGRVDGKLWRLGSARWMEELGFHAEGVICLADEQAIHGYFVVRDVLRAHAKEALSLLKEYELVMITGDQQRAAERIAHELGIDFRAEILPQDKASVVRSFQNVGMVGDGINDAPALAAADVGFAVRTGTDIAMETAGITLMNSDLRLVYAAISLSKKTFTKVKQNLFFAFIYNVLGIGLAAFGLLNPIFAGFAMAASSICVVSNSLLLNRWTPEKH